jgi:hypothetical protein
MKSLIYIVIILTSQQVYSDELKTLIEACEKSNVSFCQEFKEIKKNTESKAQWIISSYNLQNLMAITSFILKPEVKFKFNTIHEVKVNLLEQKMMYSFDF